MMIVWPEVMYDAAEICATKFLTLFVMFYGCNANPGKIDSRSNCHVPCQNGFDKDFCLEFGCLSSLSGKKVDKMSHIKQVFPNDFNELGKLKKNFLYM